MNLKEASFKLMNIRAERGSVLSEIKGYGMYPISVNGVIQDNTQETIAMLYLIKKSIALEEEIRNLQGKINIAKFKSGVTSKLMEVKEKRDTLEFLKSILSAPAFGGRQKVKIETGVGVVKYDILNKTEIEKLIKDYSKEVEALSIEIDEINASYEVE